MRKASKTQYHDSKKKALFGLPPFLLKELLLLGLREDGAQWDWTTLGDPGSEGPPPVKARVIAKSNGVWVGSGLIEILSECARDLGCQLKATARLKDGDRIKSGTIVSEWSGDRRAILALERPFLNLASYASGIATKTRTLVDQVQRSCAARTPRVTATRKTLPGYRDLALYAVQVGGGYSHRVGLSGGVLIKENHIAYAGGIAQAITAAKSIAPHGLKVEIEVRSLKELSQALSAGAEGVLLDNFLPAQVKSALKIIAAKPVRLRPFVEVSGGLNEENISEYAIEGVDILSVGSLTHSVQAVDLSLLVDG